MFFYGHLFLVVIILYIDGGEGDDTYILGLNQATSGRGCDTIVASLIEAVDNSYTWKAIS